MVVFQYVYAFKRCWPAYHPSLKTVFCYNILCLNMKKKKILFYLPYLYREAHKLIKHAAKQGVKQANQAMEEVCARGGCD